MTYPTPYTVGHHVRNQDASTDRFRASVTFTPPAEQPGTPVPVIQWAAPESAAGSRDGRQPAGYDRMLIDVELFVLPDFKPGKGDLIDLPGEGQFEVAGYPEDYNHGFHTWQPGNVIPLRRVVG